MKNKPRILTKFRPIKHKLSVSLFIVIQKFYNKFYKLCNKFLFIFFTFADNSVYDCNCYSGLNWLILDLKTRPFEKILKEKFKDFPLDNRISILVVLTTGCGHSNPFCSKLR